MFCRIFLTNKAHGVSSARNSQDIYEAMIKSCTNSMVQVIEENNWALQTTPFEIVNKMMAALSSISLHLWRSNQYSLTEEKMATVVTECRSEWYAKDIDIRRILSCALTLEQSLIDPNDISYQFSHLAFQECLAARKISEDLLSIETCSQDSIMNLERLIGLEVKSDDDKVR